MLPDWIKEIWIILPFGATATGAILGWAVRMGLASKAALDAEIKSREQADIIMRNEMLGEISKINSRMQIIEQDVQHLPTADDLANLRNEVTRVGVMVEASKRETESIGRSVTRVEDYLLNRGAS